MYACVCRKLWSNLQAPPMAMLLEDETAMELVRLSFKVASMDYQTGRQELREWRGKEAVQDLLYYLIDTNILWDEDLNAEDELGLCRKRLDPFLSAYITHLPDSCGALKREELLAAWNPLSQVASQPPQTTTQHTSLGLCTRAVNGEAWHRPLKKKQQAATAILSDLEKVALQLKDCLDNLAKQRINLDGVNVYGIVVIGYELDLFQDSYALCTRPRLSHTYVGICATLGTPVKVPLPRWD
ncbi:hypothetical protein KI688_006515 [Linnemannia hyalina]|uniref:Uncharacterized protein n=1 Tax=Linnemannia hyalina TaxID=64524 RepID=A0A9P8BNJ8_9FUNG|nr:hypothetical protein KI688_006515 [Linnemannia hyalina]